MNNHRSSEHVYFNCDQCEFEAEDKDKLKKHQEDKHVCNAHILEIKELTKYLQTVEEDRDKINSALMDTAEALKKEKDNGKKDKETIKTIHTQLKECREELTKFVEANEILLEENKTMKKIKNMKEKIDERNEKPEEVIVIEDCEDTEDKDTNADIDDLEAARVFLRNKQARDTKANKPTQTGARPKIFTCGKCRFEVKTEAKLKGHATVHEEGNVNYVKMLNCDRCPLLFKTMGLLRRHFKTEHGINMQTIPDNQDGARSRTQNKEMEDTRIKCDQCDFAATSQHLLIEHLDRKHTNKPSRCNNCGMMADNQKMLIKHMESCQKHSQQKQKVHPVCKFWLKGICNFDKFNCRFSHQGPHQKPPQCRNKSNCVFWPNCKFAHEEKLCRYQENCLNVNCTFVHLTNDFLGEGQNHPAPNIQLYQEFPQFPQQVWRPW